MKNLKIGTKIIIGIGNTLVMLAVVAIVMIISSSRTLSNIQSVKTYSEMESASNALVDIFNETRMTARSLYNGVSEADLKDFTKQNAYLLNRMDFIAKLVKEEPLLNEFEDHIEIFTSYYNSWYKDIMSAQSIYSDDNEENDVEAVNIKAEAKRIELLAHEELSKINLDVNFIVEGNLNDTVSFGSTSLITVIIISIIALIEGAIMAVYILRSITHPLNRIKSVLVQIGEYGNLNLNDTEATLLNNDAAGKDEVSMCAAAFIKHKEHLEAINNALAQVANGDLTIDMKLLSGDDSMGTAIIQMLKNLNEKFHSILDSASEVNDGSLTLMEGSQQLSETANQQSADVEELSSSISEVASKTQNNTNKAKEASQLAVKIQESANYGTDQMNRMITAMSDINEASRQISNVIKVIDDIAFQTNILALNASVEAARAGEHGKGFAVVANEVRTLANKSAEAASDTASLIENTINKVSLGTEIAEATSKSFGEIVSGIEKSTELINDISLLSTEQSASMNEINTGVERVASVVGKTSATAEESASASDNMQSQAANLKNLVAQFKLKM